MPDGPTHFVKHHPVCAVGKPLQAYQQAFGSAHRCRRDLDVRHGAALAAFRHLGESNPGAGCSIGVNHSSTFLTQAKKRKDGKNDDDKADQIDDVIHQMSLLYAC